MWCNSAAGEYCPKKSHPSRWLFAFPAKEKPQKCENNHAASLAAKITLRLKIKTEPALNV